MVDPRGALTAIKPLEQVAGLKIRISLYPKELPELKSAKDELVQCINHLKARNRIFNTLPTLDEVLDPPEEVEIRKMDIFSAGGKGGEGIVDAVHHGMAVAGGGVIGTNSDEGDNPEPCITRIQVMVLCEQLVGAVLEYGEAEDILKLSKRLCHFRAHSRRKCVVKCSRRLL